MSPHPPRLAELLLRRCLPGGVVGMSIVGDLHQEFREEGRSRRFPSLQMWYWNRAIRLGGWYLWARLRGGRHRPLRLRSVFEEGIGMPGLVQDIKYATRRLRRTPGFTIVALLTLALGIGANTAMFTVLNSVFLRALPYAEPDRLLVVYQTTEVAGGQERPASYPAFEYWRDNTRVFDRFAASSRTTLALRWGEDPERIAGGQVSASLFGLLGVSPLVGRGFSPEEDVAGAEPVVVLAHGLWQRLFSGDPAAIGKTIRLGDHVRTIVGVMPADFRFPGDDPQYWVPMATANRAANTHGLQLLGRLADGVSIEQARSDVVTVGERLQTDNATAKNGDGTAVVLLRDRMVENSGPMLGILAVTVVFVLTIACANLANLLLARSTVRQKEIAIRTALGSSARRVAQMFLAESMVLALVGGAMGIVVAFAATQAFVGAAPDFLPRRNEIAMDGRVLGFAVLASLVVGMIVGIAPALRVMRANIVNDLRQGGRTGSGQKLQGAFTVVQMAVALVLLVGTGLLAKSLWKLQGVDPGFVAANALTAGVSLPSSEFPQFAQRVIYYDQLERELEAAPGVRAVGAISFLPFGGWSSSGFGVEGKTYEAGQFDSAEYAPVTPGYFAAMGIPVLAGRTFTDEDRRGAASVIVINRTMAEQFWPGEDPIGKRIGQGSRGNPTYRTVIGVVGDVKHHGLTTLAQPKFYRAYAQSGWPYSLTLVLRTEDDPLGHVGTVRAALRRLDDDPPVARMESLEARVGSLMAEPRFNAALLGIFTLTAVTLASLGIYGVISFGAAQRTKEIGVRMAVGGNRAHVRRYVMGGGVRLSLLGVAIGLAGAFGLTRLIASVLFETSTTDPVVYGFVSVVLVAVAALASFVPAHRASKVDPLIALRQE
ncbi:MAG: ABC transporter permease [Gemmatimonadetes bacterium]|nr:ABC transporter permease [Gemmatimonadota bacterium]